MKRYDSGCLYTALEKLLATTQTPDNHANALLECMFEADFCGVHSHGLNVFPAHFKKILDGGYDFEPIRILKETGAFAVVDAANQIGMVSSATCMQLAIDSAKKSGIFTVFARNANTFGPAFYYAKMATDQRMIGICFSNSPSAMPAWNGKKKLLGTNPFAVGVPGKVQGPVLLDMATSVVAKSKINEIRKAGGELPEGWALDENGEPTTDPATAIRGMVLPMAGHKGYGIAMAIDLLSGVLSGAGYLNHINRFYSEDHQCMNVGQCFVAMDPAMICSEDFYENIDAYIEEVHDSGEKVLFPGERKIKNRELAAQYGVELSRETAEALKKLFDQYNIENGLIER